MKTFIKFILHYLDPRSTFVGLLILCGVLSCALYFTFKYFLKISLSDEIFWPASLAATGFILIRFLECRTKRYNTLCGLEVELNQAMDTLGCLIMTLQSMIQKQMPVLMPHALPYLTLDYLNSVGRIDIKNNLANLLCDFRRINQDWNNFIEYGNDNAQILHNPSHLENQRAKAIGTQLMGTILHKCESSFKLVEETLVFVRIYLRTDKSFFRFHQPFIWLCEMSVDIEEERKKLISERRSNQ